MAKPRSQSQPHRTEGCFRLTLGILLALAIAGLSARPAESTASVSDPLAEGTPAEDTADVSPAEREIIERILDLERQIQDLRDQLSAGSQALLDEELDLQAIDRVDDTEIPVELTDPVSTASRDEVGVAESMPAEVSPVALESTPVGPSETVPEPTASPQSTEQAGGDARSDSSGCNTLRPFDTSGDGVLSGTDRYWRYLRLWVDRNRDGAVQDAEVQHPFDFGIVEISGRLRVFHTDKKGVGDIRHDDRIYFEPVGKKNETGILMVDATRIQRGNGLTLLASGSSDEDGVGEAGTVLEGLQAFRTGLILRDAEGETTHLNCP